MVAHQISVGSSGKYIFRVQKMLNSFHEPNPEISNLLARRDNQILVLNLSILLSKKQKKVSDGLQWLSEDILG